MTPWPGSHPPRIGPRSQPEVLLWKCLLDAEAYNCSSYQKRSLIEISIDDTGVA